MKNAYMIMAHHNFDQLGVLLDLLDDPQNDFYVHIDSKADQVDFGEISAHVVKGSICFTPRRNVTWGGDSQIWCVLELLRFASATYHDYYHLLSGDDLPIKTNVQIANYLEAHKGKEFVGLYARGTASELPDHLTKCFRYRWPFQNINSKSTSKAATLALSFLKAFRTTRRGKFEGEFAKGPLWFSITDDFAHYVIDHEQQLREMFSDGLNCDEIFLQTLYVNSPFGNGVTPERDDNAMALRLIDWDRSNGASPWIFTKDDFAMIKSSECLFARKFDKSVDSAIIEQVRDYLTAPA